MSPFELAEAGQPFQFRNVLDFKKQARPGSTLADLKLSEFAQALEAVSGNQGQFSSATSPGSNLPKRLSAEMDMLIERSGAPQMSGEIFRQALSPFGKGDLGQEVGETIPRGFVDFAPLLALAIPGVNVGAGGLMATAALSGSLVGLNAFEKTSSPKKAFASGAAAAATPLTGGVGGSFARAGAARMGLSGPFAQRAATYLGGNVGANLGFVAADVATEEDGLSLLANPDYWLAQAVAEIPFAVAELPTLMTGKTTLERAGASAPGRSPAEARAQTHIETEIDDAAGRVPDASVDPPSSLPAEPDPVINNAFSRNLMNFAREQDAMVERIELDESRTPTEKAAAVAELKRAFDATITRYRSERSRAEDENPTLLGEDPDGLADIVREFELDETLAEVFGETFDSSGQEVPNFPIEPDRPTPGEAVDSLTDNLAGARKYQEKYIEMGGDPNRPAEDFVDLVGDPVPKDLETFEVALGTSSVDPSAPTIGGDSETTSPTTPDQAVAGVLHDMANSSAPHSASEFAEGLAKVAKARKISGNEQTNDGEIRNRVEAEVEEGADLESALSEFEDADASYEAFLASSEYHDGDYLPYSRPTYGLKDPKGKEFRANWAKDKKAAIQQYRMLLDVLQMEKVPQQTKTVKSLAEFVKIINKDPEKGIWELDRAIQGTLVKLRGINLDKRFLYEGATEMISRIKLLNQNSVVQMVPLGEIPAKEKSMAILDASQFGATFDTTSRKIIYSANRLAKLWNEKAWKNPPKLEDGTRARPILEDFTRSEWAEFVYYHELVEARKLLPPWKRGKESRGSYETRVSEKALELMGRQADPRLAKFHSLESDANKALGFKSTRAKERNLTESFDQTINRLVGGLVTDARGTKPKTAKNNAIKAEAKKAEPLLDELERAFSRVEGARPILRSIRENFKAVSKGDVFKFKAITSGELHANQYLRRRLKNPENGDFTELQQLDPEVFETHKALIDQFDQVLHSVDKAATRKYPEQTPQRRFETWKEAVDFYKKTRADYTRLARNRKQRTLANEKLAELQNFQRRAADILLKEADTHPKFAEALRRTLLDIGIEEGGKPSGRNLQFGAGKIKSLVGEDLPPWTIMKVTRPELVLKDTGKQKTIIREAAGVPDFSNQQFLQEVQKKRAQGIVWKSIEQAFAQDRNPAIQYGIRNTDPNFWQLDTSSTGQRPLHGLIRTVKIIFDNADVRIGAPEWVLKTYRGVDAVLEGPFAKTFAARLAELEATDPNVAQVYRETGEKMLEEVKRLLAFYRKEAENSIKQKVPTYIPSHQRLLISPAGEVGKAVRQAVRLISDEVPELELTPFAGGRETGAFASQLTHIIQSRVKGKTIFQIEYPGPPKGDGTYHVKRGNIFMPIARAISVIDKLVNKNDFGTARGLAHDFSGHGNEGSQKLLPTGKRNALEALRKAGADEEVLAVVADAYDKIIEIYSNYGQGKDYADGLSSEQLYNMAPNPPEKAKRLIKEAPKPATGDLFARPFSDSARKKAEEIEDFKASAWGKANPKLASKVDEAIDQVFAGLEKSDPVYANRSLESSNLKGLLFDFLTNLQITTVADNPAAAAYARFKLKDYLTYYAGVSTKDRARGKFNHLFVEQTLTNSEPNVKIPEFEESETISNLGITETEASDSTVRGEEGPFDAVPKTSGEDDPFALPAPENSAEVEEALAYMREMQEIQNLDTLEPGMQKLAKMIGFSSGMDKAEIELLVQMSGVLRGLFDLPETTVGALESQNGRGRAVYFPERLLILLNPRTIQMTHERLGLSGRNPVMKVLAHEFAHGLDHFAEKGVGNKAFLKAHEQFKWWLGEATIDDKKTFLRIMEERLGREFGVPEKRRLFQHAEGVTNEFVADTIGFWAETVAEAKVRGEDARGTLTDALNFMPKPARDFLVQLTRRLRKLFQTISSSFKSLSVREEIAREVDGLIEGLDDMARSLRESQEAEAQVAAFLSSTSFDQVSVTLSGTNPYTGKAKGRLDLADGFADYHFSEQSNKGLGGLPRNVRQKTRAREVDGELVEEPVGTSLEREGPVSTLAKQFVMRAETLAQAHPEIRPMFLAAASHYSGIKGDLKGVHGKLLDGLDVNGDLIIDANGQSLKDYQLVAQDLKVNDMFTALANEMQVKKQIIDPTTLDSGPLYQKWKRLKEAQKRVVIEQLQKHRESVGESHRVLSEALLKESVMEVASYVAQKIEGSGLAFDNVYRLAEQIVYNRLIDTDPELAQANAGLVDYAGVEAAFQRAGLQKQLLEADKLAGKFLGMRAKLNELFAGSPEFMSTGDLSTELKWNSATIYEGINKRWSGALKRIDADRAQFIREISDLGDESKEAMIARFDYRSELENIAQQMRVERVNLEGKRDLNNLTKDAVAAHRVYTTLVVGLAHSRLLNSSLRFYSQAPEFKTDSGKLLLDEMLQRVQNYKMPDTEIGKAINQGVFQFTLGLNFASHLAELIQPAFTYVPLLQSHELGYLEAGKMVMDAENFVKDVSWRTMTDVIMRRRKEDRLSSDVWREKGGEEFAVLMEKVGFDDLVSMGLATDIAVDTTSEINGTIEMLAGPKAGSLAKRGGHAIQQFMAMTGRFYSFFTEHNARVAVMTGWNLAKRKFPNEPTLVLDPTRPGKKMPNPLLYDEMRMFVYNATASTGRLGRPSALMATSNPYYRTAGLMMNSLQSYTQLILGQAIMFAEKGFSTKRYPELSAAERAENRRAFLSLALTQLTGAGLLGMPFVAAAIAALEELTDWEINKWMVENLAKFWGEDEATGGFMTEFSRRGLLNATTSLTGFSPDIGSRLAVGGVLGLNSFDGWSPAALLGPSASIGEDLIKGTGKLFAGDVKGFSRDVLPVALKRPFDLILGGGEIRDQGGQRVIDAGWGEKAAYMIGFTPQQVTQIRETQRMQGRHREIQRRRVADFHDRVSNMVFQNPDQARALLLEREAASQGTYSAKAGAKAVAEAVVKKQLPYDPRREAPKSTSLSEMPLLRAMNLQRIQPSEATRIQMTAEVMNALGFGAGAASVGVAKATKIDQMIQKYPWMTYQIAKMLVEGEDVPSVFTP